MMRVRLLFLLIALLAWPAIGEEWSHIDYGSANIGSGGVGSGADMSEAGLAVAIRHLERLVAAHKGKSGIFYVNDLEAKDSHRAAVILQKYCNDREYAVEVRSVPGSFISMEASQIPQTDTASFSNPEGIFISTPIDMDRVIRKMQSRTKSLRLESSAIKLFETFITYFPDAIRLENAPSYLRPDGSRNYNPVGTFVIPNPQAHKFPRASERARLGTAACDAALGLQE